MIIHTVKNGEGLREVAARYGISPIKLAAINGIKGERLIAGEELLVLLPSRTANVRHGESLGDLGRRFGVRESTLIAINPELEGIGAVYEGQPITVRAEAPLFGLGIGNGYFYRGATRADLRRTMPYLSYLTVCSAVARGDTVTSLFDDRELVAAARREGKLPLLRIWLSGDRAPEKGLFESAALMAAARGYHGVTLAADRRLFENGLLREAHESFAECGLKTVAECDPEALTPDIGEVDMTVLVYDKIHLDPMPDFECGEARVFRKYADEHNASRAFIDLSPFALARGKYITKSKARDGILRSGASLEASECGSVLRASSVRRGRSCEWVSESLKSTERKLKMLSELGFYGISFDIARSPISELMMFRTMFSESIKMS